MTIGRPRLFNLGDPCFNSALQNACAGFWTAPLYSIIGGYGIAIYQYASKVVSSVLKRPHALSAFTNFAKAFVVLMLRSVASGEKPSSCRESNQCASASVMHS